MHFIIVLPPWFLWVFLVSQLNDIPITEALLFHFPILDTCDIYYYLLSKQGYIHQNVRTASIPRLSRTVFEKMQILLPPLEEQKRIVAILDRFDTLCNDISAGLPAEIEARRKQYEYYRDKLLSFTRLPDGQEER